MCNEKVCASYNLYTIFTSCSYFNNAIDSFSFLNQSVEKQMLETN